MKQDKQFEKFIKKKGCRLTEERLKLMEGIRRQRGHFNVDELIHRLRKQGFEVSRDTVYRNIPILIEAGVLEQSFKTSRDTFYESVHSKSHHDHLICRSCGRVIEFKDPEIEEMQKRIARKNAFKLEHHYHQLVGLCKKCLK